MDLSHILTHLGEDREDYFNAVAPPVMQTSNFRFRDTAEMQSLLKNETEEILYTRGNNPTVEILRKKMAALEHTEDALIFASGSAGIAASVIANVEAGDHVVCVEHPYSWTYNLLTRFLPRFGVTATFVDGRSISNFENALQPNTRIIFLESPNTFLLELQDLEAVSKLAKKHGILTMIDNSCAGPLYQNPADLGIDIVMHSASKYIGGHSDIVAGVVCGSHEMMQKIHRSELMTLGAIISPWNAWLMIRSLRTLELRMDRISENAIKVAAFLENHEAIAKLHYPFSSKNPQKDLALKQMKKGTGLMTIELKANKSQQVATFCESLQRFLLAVSWGGHESLVLPVFTTFKEEGPVENNPEFKLVRLYIGLEDADALIEDLGQSLQKFMADIN
jgi:cystathionine beta-lyase/cystathionine gamma-synthase